MNEPSRPRFDFLLAGIPALALLLQVLALPAYGWFRDEFYYLACSEHLAFGYVDHPPLSILFLWIVRGLFGASIWAVRLVPALVLAGVVALVGRIAIEMGGGRFACAVAMLGAVCAPIYLGLGHIYTMNVFDLLFWASAALLVVRIANGAGPRAWVVLGVVLGLGLQNKISVLWLGTGLLAGLVLTTDRRHLRTRWPWIAGGLAGTIFLPHVLWQMANGWPTLEFMARATGEKMAALEILPFLAAQVLFMGPAAVWLWIGGLVWLMRPAGARYRSLAWAWLTVLAILLLSGSARPAYMAPAYTWLLAAGGVATEAFLAAPRRNRLRPAAVAALLAGLSLAPLALPLLPVPTYLRYTDRLGIAPTTDERKELAELPQLYADMHGWEEIVATVAEAYAQLSDDEKVQATIFAQNYGVAGAIDLLGRRHGLPTAVSGHNNYWFWGPGEPASVVLIVGGRESDHRRSCGRLETAAVIDCGYCMPYENDQPVFVCRDLMRPIEEIWPQVKHFD